MHKVLLLGAGKIGRAIAAFLTDSGEYDVLVGDASETALQKLTTYADVKTRALDATSAEQLRDAMQDRDSVLSALSFSFNPLIAQVATETQTSYFDLTEDVETTRRVRAYAERCVPGRILMPQCGLAPGFISIVAWNLAQQFQSLDRVHMRVGALPQYPSNLLKYNLTWSTDGLINEYCNPCEAIHEGRLVDVLPMEGLESFSLDGVRYEAFNTSGGLGSLCETLEGKVRELNYRTIRYQGHRDLMQLLLKDLRMTEKRDQLKSLLEDAVPVTYQDVVIVFVNVSGMQNGQFTQVSDARKIYHQEIAGHHWGAIQITTAAGICAALDLHATGKLPSTGFVRQEDVRFDEFIANRFGGYYADAHQSSVG
ncbi:MAG: saccharopine dehydrogenase NADP-binding domain-containing protein [Planctomycetaceae bacterium]|nr:saccharopine dehydrogenase NADP-binding domain-containing protein [Planctomycetaceae bacterium]